MINKEFVAVFDISPEDFKHGRVDLARISQIDQESDLSTNIINKDIERPEFEVRLNDGKSQEHVVFARRISERPRNKDQKLDISPWEPFNLEPNSSQRFVNLYGGPFSAQMELNRANADRLLEVAGIQGDVILTDVPMDRNRGIAGVNADGSVSKKRNLFFGEKLEEDESKAIVKPTPKGWKIEIPGQEMLEELSRQESKKSLDKRFITKINEILRESISKIIIKDKLVGKDNLSYIFTIMPLLASSLIITGDYNYRASISLVLINFLIDWGYPLAVDKSTEKSSGRIIYRHREELYENFMPPLEIDRALRGIMFLNMKGKNLVRLRPDENTTSAG